MEKDYQLQLLGKKIRVIREKLGETHLFPQIKKL